MGSSNSVKTSNKKAVFQLKKAVFWYKIGMWKTIYKLTNVLLSFFGYIPFAPNAVRGLLELTSPNFVRYFYDDDVVSELKDNMSNVSNVLRFTGKLEDIKSLGDTIKKVGSTIGKVDSTAGQYFKYNWYN